MNKDSYLKLQQKKQSQQEQTAINSAVESLKKNPNFNKDLWILGYQFAEPLRSQLWQQAKELTQEDTYWYQEM